MDMFIFIDVINLICNMFIIGITLKMEYLGQKGHICQTGIEKKKV